MEIINDEEAFALIKCVRKHKSDFEIKIEDEFIYENLSLLGYLTKTLQKDDEYEWDVYDISPLGKKALRRYINSLNIDMLEETK